MIYDVVIIGGGIVGISTAWQLQNRFPYKHIMVLEKEPHPAMHQTGHNSGVIHAGVYYQPGSLKADFCKRGAIQTISFCKEHDLPYQQCGKILVATNRLEYERMKVLEARCIQNGIEIRRLSGEELEKREPAISGVGPNAVLGWKREGYGCLNLDLKDSFDMLTFPGFWKVIGKNLLSGIGEFKDSLYKSGYLERVRKYCPSLTKSDLLPYPAGIRAQAVKKDGSLVHDFLFAQSSRSLHVCNAPSPAATSAMPIADYLCQKVVDIFEL